MKNNVPKILIVDDNPKNIQLLAGLLTEENYELEYSTNGSDALQWMDAEGFDLVLLDIMMPDMDGFEVCKKIKSNQKYQDLPIVFLTAKTDIESIKKAFSTGGVDYITKPFGREELLARVATHINLKRSKDKLKELNVQLEKKVEERTSELKKTIKELEVAMYKAEASNRLKTAFMNNISHEIRTPLNGILGFAPLIMDNEISDEEKGMFLENLTISSNRLLRTITDYLDISLIVTGNQSVHNTSVDIKKLLQREYNQAQINLANNTIDFKYEVPDDLENIELSTDECLLTKSLFQILDNAIKFTPNGSVVLGYKIKNNEIEIFVKDTGQGIAPSAQKDIFNFFIQEDISLTRTFEGSGLGLAIAKGCIELLKGKIYFESEKDRGSTFIINLPVNPSNNGGDEESKANSITKQKIKEILIAEDDDQNFLYFNVILKKTKLKIHRAKNGKEAVESCRTNSGISLVLMDIKMPEMDGLEATKLIKSFRNELPIIAITAFAQYDDEVKIKNAGCDEYLAKPVPKEKLLAAIAKF
mgnify:CR=1 FL=1